jgi:hypothetical protein
MQTRELLDIIEKRALENGFVYQEQQQDGLSIIVMKKLNEMMLKIFPKQNIVKVTSTIQQFSSNWSRLIIPF